MDNDTKLDKEPVSQDAPVEGEEQPHRKLLEMAEDEDEQRQKAERKKKMRKEVRDWVLLIVGTLLVVFLVRTYVFEPIVVDGPSMNETLYTGDRVFVTKFDYLLGEPERGTVVICHYPNSRENYIKRVVGLPGETISIVDGVTYVDGEALKEDFIAHPAKLDFGPLTLGADEYFVMGDNRGNSNDSRAVGPLKKSQIVGRVRYLFFPFDRTGTVVQQYVN
ncbi:MAG: signal peptidase I [Candidatus Fimadaptatus sp.]|jgi:signal peptidase I